MLEKGNSDTKLMKEDYYNSLLDEQSHYYNEDEMNEELNSAAKKLNIPPHVS